MTAILIVASSPVMRAGLAAVIAADPANRIVGQISSGSGVTEAVRTLHPDVVLLDLDVHSDDPLPIGASPASETPALVVLIDAPGAEWMAESLRHGVLGILPREASPEAIRATVASASQGLVSLHPSSVRTLLPAITAPVPVRAGSVPHPALTPREIEVLGMLAEGLGNKMIARQLGISDHTVKFHISSIFTKLGVSTRTEAVTQGARQGLIML